MLSSACRRLLNAGRVATLTSLVAACFAASAQASPIAVINGSFEQTTTKTSSQFGSDFSSQQITGWTAAGYNFVFLPGTSDTTGAVGQYGNLKLWGPGDGFMNGLPASSPDGGNFLAMDGAYEQGPISQMLSGLTVGTPTTVSFYFGGVQQYGYTGVTTEQFEVSLGDQHLYTPVLTDASHSFTGWQMESLTFSPTSTNEVLSFLAIGTPGGEPPMSLLDGVSVSSSPVPEPSSIALLMTGFAGVGNVVRKRLKKDSKR